MTAQRQVASGHMWRRTQRALLVDDDPDDRGSLKALFIESQWDVLDASSRREALNILNHHAVDIVLLDAAPQGVDCAEILDAVRQRIRDLPVIIMGALMTPELRRALRSREAMECLAKPFESQTLPALLLA